MEKYGIIFRKRLCEKCFYVFTTTNPTFSPNDLYYGMIFFFTAAKEVAVISGESHALKEFRQIIEDYATTEVQKRYAVKGIQHAWEFFADKSRNGYSFHIWSMFPQCPNCENSDTTTMKVIDSLEENIAPQPILYTQWNLYSDKEKRKILHDFFDKYIDDERAKYK